MHDVQKADDWGQACERMAREHRRMVGGIGETHGAVERKLATALCDVMDALAYDQVQREHRQHGGAE